MVDTSINKTYHPNGFSISNHKNVTTHRARTERRDTDEPTINENENTHEGRDATEDPPQNTRRNTEDPNVNENTKPRQ